MNTKYKIELIEGCVTFNTFINGKSIEDFSKEGLDEIVDYLIDQIKENYKRGGTTFEQLVIGNFHYHHYECDNEKCDSCGDIISTSTYNI